MATARLLLNIPLNIMSKMYLRTVSALAALALMGGAAGAATLASAQTTSVTTQAATNISSTNATLNGTDGPIAATGTAFWVSTSTFTATAGTNPPLPSGVFSTGNLGSVSAGGNFSALLSSSTIPSHLQVAPGTTYYYMAWSNINGMWTPGSLMNFTTTGTSTGTTTSPVVSNVQISNTSPTSVTISWNTDVPATGVVSYGTTTSYGSSASTTGTASTSQSVTLSGLNPGTMYHFAITASAGTTTTADMTFTTTGSITGTSTAPLIVSGIDPVRTTGIADNNPADGWEWVMHFTVPAGQDAFHIAFGDWTMNGNSNTTFPADSNMAIWSAQSGNASSSTALVPILNNGYSDWLYLTGPTNSDGTRTVDVHVLVRIPTGTQPGNYSSNFTAQTWPSNATSTAPTTP
jgi:hypothetical protein